MEAIKVKSETPEGIEVAKRLQGVLKSLIKTGFVNPREHPRVIMTKEVIQIIRRITGGQCS